MKRRSLFSLALVPFIGAAKTLIGLEKPGTYIYRVCVEKVGGLMLEESIYDCWRMLTPKAVIALRKYISRPGGHGYMTREGPHIYDPENEGTSHYKVWYETKKVKVLDVNPDGYVKYEEL